MRFRIILSLLSLDERIEAAGEEEQEAIRLSDIANDLFGAVGPRRKSRSLRVSLTVSKRIRRIWRKRKPMRQKR
ncbi:hypothetical protein FOXB_06599 [Fusarium oxysporum f. sp. conglutinans Fo5176]|uniref:Uncharacterized protein n=1 Tax=Fusarium oxysporum (strain Fo5176) TaxID=660025 RepID=F9FJM0_FUSOF|nr:hypothetical protein FOXB_06599 [Fusarium oxysporum f. sp. conglutinans Fo5176]